MPIENTPLINPFVAPTPEEKARQVVADLRQAHFQMGQYIVRMYNRSYNAVYNTPDVTPEQIAAAMKAGETEGIRIQAILIKTIVKHVSSDAIGDDGIPVAELIMPPNLFP